MNRRVLLVLVIGLTLTTAVVHLLLGGGMVAMMAGGRPGGPGGGQFGPPNGQTPQGGQFPANGQPPGPGRAGPGGLMAALPIPLPILFVLNAIGYLALLALIVLPIPYFKDHAALTHWLLIGYAALTFVLYFAMNGTGRFFENPMAVVAKVAELLLIVVTFLHLRAMQSSGNVAVSPTPVATT